MLKAGHNPAFNLLPFVSRLCNMQISMCLLCPLPTGSPMTQLLRHGVLDECYSGIPRTPAGCLVLGDFPPPILAFTPYTLHPTPNETSPRSSLFHSFTISHIHTSVCTDLLFSFVHCLEYHSSVFFVYPPFPHLLCTSRFHREKSPSINKKSHQNAIFLAFLQKLLYLCTRN